MTSQINPTIIRGDYPIAGQDNNSQGFRDNFQNIKNNFNFTKIEIEDLQSKVVLKEPLTGTSISGTFNDFADSQLANARVIGTRETAYDHGTVSGTVTLNFSNGLFQFIKASGNLTFTLTGWPESNARHARMRVLVDTATLAAGSSRILTVDTGSANFVNLDNLPGYLNPTSITLYPGYYLFEFSTYDSGDTIFVNELFKNQTNENRSSYKTLFANLSAYSNVVTLTGNVGTLVLDSFTTASATINLPANVNLYDGQKLTIISNVNITSCNIFANGGTIGGGVSRVSGFSANTANVFVFNKTVNGWFGG